MDIVTKIITLIGGIIGLVSAVSIMFGVKEIRSGMSNDDPRTLDKGIEKVVVGGAVILAIGGVVAYVTWKLPIMVPSTSLSRGFRQ